MIIRDIKNTLFQFKRVHKSQLASKHPILPPNLNAQIKRKTLKNMQPQELKKLVAEILSSIQNYQKSREKPHQGLERFQKDIHETLYNT